MSKDGGGERIEVGSGERFDAVPAGPYRPAMLPVRATSLPGRWLGIALLVVFAGGGLGQTKAPTLGELVLRGVASQKRILKDGAHWELTADTGNGARFLVGVRSAPPDFEVRFMVQPAGHEPQRLARVIGRGGKWHVDEVGGVRGIFRPWEAPFAFEILGVLLSEAWPRSYEPERSHRLERVDANGVAMIRVPLVGEQRATAEGFLREVAGLEDKPGPELSANIAEIRRRLKEGSILRVGTQSGLARNVNLGGLSLNFEPVRWMKKPPEIEIPKDLRDFSAPLAGKAENHIMIGHAGAWRPGRPEMEPGCRLLNLETGERRRVPFEGGSCLAGCFVAKRTQVAVTGRNSAGGVENLFLIDLESGKNRRLGSVALSTGVCYGPALSPDGKTLAVLHRSSAEKILEVRFHLVDLESGESRPIGKAFDGHSLSWLPDGSGLIGVIRRHEGPDQAGDRQIVRFGLDGSVTDLREGDFALLVGPQRDRIFFQGKDSAWFTCDLKGGDVKLVGAGLKKLSFPSVSPNGEHVIMMADVPGTGPSPVIVDLATGKPNPVKVGPGMWMAPVWR